MGELRINLYLNIITLVDCYVVTSEMKGLFPINIIIEITMLITAIVYTISTCPCRMHFSKYLRLPLNGSMADATVFFYEYKLTNSLISCFCTNCALVSISSCWMPCVINTCTPNLFFASLTHYVPISILLSPSLCPSVCLKYMLVCHGHNSLSPFLSYSFLVSLYLCRCLCLSVLLFPSVILTRTHSHVYTHWTKHAGQ